MRKKIYALFFMGACCLMGTNALALNPNGEGVYEIASADDLLAFSALVNGGNENINAVLTADIDMEGVTFAPIGYASFSGLYHEGRAITNVGFAGTFDGQGHVIKNLTAVYSTNYAASGVFGIVSGTVKNLGVVNYRYDINDYGKAAYAGHFGALCAEVLEGLVINCYVTNSTIINPNQIAGMVAATNYGGTLQNCYECDNEIQAYQRAGRLVGDARDDRSVRIGTEINCYSEGNVTGSYPSTIIDCESQVNKERFQNGEITFKLNGSTTTSTSVWRQNLEADKYPVLDATHGYIMPLADKFISFPEDNFESVRDDIYKSETDYNKSVICSRLLNNNYEQMLESFSKVSTIEDFFAMFGQLNDMKAQLVSSAQSYAAYQVKIDEINAYLAENDANVVGKERMVLDTYLKEVVGPNEMYPNGSYAYIMENRNSDKETLTEEIAFAQNLLDRAIAGGYTPGTDITSLLVNSDFSDGTNGWTIEDGSFDISNVPNAGMKYVGSSTDKFRLSQTLTGLRPGFYQIKVSAAYRAANDNLNMNQASFFFANNNKVYVPTLSEAPIPLDTDSPNIEYYYPLEDEEGLFLGYIPTSTMEMAYAFGEGYYQSTLVAEVGADSTLTVGIHTPGCDKQNSTWVGAFHLAYCGTAGTNEANTAFMETQLCQLSRLSTVANDYTGDNLKYDVMPNYSKTLRNEASAAVEKGPVNSEQFEHVRELGDLMQTIYECKQAYAGMMSKAEAVLDLYYNLIQSNLLKEADEEALKMLDSYKLISGAFLDGTFSLEEALAVNPLEGLPFALNIVDDVAQISNSAELMTFSAMVNSGYYSTLDAVLTADIDMEGINSYAPIGYVSLDELNHAGQDITNPGYEGTFDGQGHVIKNLTAVYNSAYAASGVFGSVTGMVKNLGVVNYRFNVNDSPEANYPVRAGALCGQLVEGTILNCYVTNSTVIKTNEIVSSIAAGNYGGTIRNCYEFNNDIQPFSRAGRLVGDARDDGNVRIGTEINCYSEGRVTGDYPSTIIDCEGQVSKKRFQSGEITYKLNGDQSNIAWYQTLDEGGDTSPVLDPTHARVYLNVGQKCDGTLKGKAVYSNTDNGSIRDPHIFVDGFCSVCNAPDPDYVTMNANGFYELDTAAALKWFSALVNGGYENANAVLTADIDMEGVTFAPIGYASFSGLYHEGRAITNVGFAGTFDGQGHVIKNLTAVYSTNYAASGVFGIVSGTVKNLGVVNYRYDINDYGKAAYAGHFGALCAEVLEGLVINCYVTNSTIINPNQIAGMVAATNYGGTLQNCYECDNEIQAYQRAGRLVGDGHDDKSVRIGTVINCYSEGRITGDFACTMTDCEGQVSKERFQNGEIAYKLNGSQSKNPVWFQTLGEDDYPILDPTHGIVTQGEDGTYDSTTGVDTVLNPEPFVPASDDIYDLSGRKMSNGLKKGIYIMNGHKVLIK